MAYRIETVKHEEKGFFSPDYRVTVRDSNDNVRTSDWQKSESKATQQATERLSQSNKK